MCKDDREEEIANAKFDGDTIRKETVFRNVSIVNNLKATSEGFWIGVKRTVSLAWMKCVQNTKEQRAVVPVPQMWKKNDEETQRISKYVDAQH